MQYLIAVAGWHWLPVLAQSRVLARCPHCLVKQQTAEKSDTDS